MYNNFVAEGDKIIMDLVASKRFEVEFLLYTDRTTIPEHIFLEIPAAQHLKIPESQMEGITHFQNASPSYLVLKRPVEQTRCPELTGSYYFYIDRLQDPGNLGTILRTADWFGIAGILIRPGSVDPYHAKVIQSSMGSIGRVPVFEVELEELPSDLPHVKVGLDMQGQDMKDFIWPKQAIFFFGNEGAGLSDEAKQVLDIRVTISGAAGRGAESLNVAIAAGIVAFSAFAQGAK